MGVVVAQSQGVAALAELPALEGLAGASGSAGVAARVALLLGQAAQATSAQQAAAVSGIGPLASVIRVQALNVNTARIVATLPRLAAAGTLTASQPVVATSTLGAISAEIVVQALNVNTARIVASLPRLLGAGTVNASGTVHATGRLEIATAATVGTSQAVHARAVLPRLWAFLALGSQDSAYIDATLGPLSAKGAVQPPPSGYAADGNYYVALPLRPFYATLAARPFYVLSNPNMTPSFDTLDPREEHVLTLDATPDLADGETLVSISDITAVLQFGAAGSQVPTLTGELINTEPLNLTVQGKPVTVAPNCAVQVIASGGISGCRYLIAATCTTTNPDKVLTLKGVLPVSAT